MLQNLYFAETDIERSGQRPLLWTTDTFVAPQKLFFLALCWTLKQHLQVRCSVVSWEKTIYYSYFIVRWTVSLPIASKQKRLFTTKEDKSHKWFLWLQIIATSFTCALKGIRQRQSVIEKPVQNCPTNEDFDLSSMFHSSIQKFRCVAS